MGVDEACDGGIDWIGSSGGLPEVCSVSEVISDGCVNLALAIRMEAVQRLKTP